VVVREVAGVTVVEVVVGSGPRVGRGAVGVVVEGIAVVVTGVGLGIFDVSTTITSLPAPAPTDVSATKPSPVKASAQL
jgi:hypothetical protein